MALIYAAPLPQATALPARELSTATRRQRSTLRSVYPGRGRRSLQNRQQGSLAWLICRGNEFNVHRAGIYGVQKHDDSADVLLRHGLYPVVASLRGDGPGAEELVQAPDDNADRYPSCTDFSWDPYLGEVTVCEKVEDPPQYVPPPPIPAQDICIRDKVESLLYGLERILPGQLDDDKADALCSMLSAAVEVQNPAVCFRGSDKCSEWLRALLQLQASINLHELYYENDMEDPDKRWVYAVWTVRFVEHVPTKANDLIEKWSESESAQLSGEMVFEMEKTGLVSRISSTWYVLQEDDGASFSKAKDLLRRVLGRTF